MILKINDKCIHDQYIIISFTKSHVKQYTYQQIMNIYPNIRYHVIPDIIIIYYISYHIFIYHIYNHISYSFIWKIQNIKYDSFSCPRNGSARFLALKRHHGGTVLHGSGLMAEPELFRTVQNGSALIRFYTKSSRNGSARRCGFDHGIKERFCTVPGSVVFKPFFDTYFNIKTTYTIYISYLILSYLILTKLS